MSIELTGGIITAETTKGVNGIRHVPDNIGKRHFFMTLIEDEGEAVLWSGASYSEAKEQARGAAIDCGCGVNNRALGIA
ncbi:hypothetical protein SAMN06265173_1324 [Thalassovita litoralis]|uniref:DUF1508 domain-containing protein n=1 Tax=Thalassovita litoralis TaxID=1010611 RepID=A0A521FJP6_9RHOB|nr:hypothetical protein [Thalassovita litoralis]SMO96329.1 hypothetical protein SAMN06265173_1324 [Thalassovita litoralis]